MGTFQISSAAACALAFLSLPAEPAAQGRQGGPPIKVVAGELSENPQLFHGSTVTVHAEVENVLSPNLFTLDEDRVLSAGKDVLVFVARPDAVPLEGKSVTVTGIVRPFVQAEFVRDFDWFYPDPDLFARFHSRPVIFATSGVTESGKELVRTAVPSTQETPSRTEDKMSAPETAIADFAAIVNAPDASSMVGLRAKLSGATVQGIAGPRSFWIGGATGPQVFVVVDGATIQAVTPAHTQLQPGMRVNVVGDIKRLPGTEGKVTVTDWGVPPPDAEKLKTQQLYVYAARVETQSAPATSGTNAVGTTGDADRTRQADASVRSIRIVARDYRFEPRELTVAPGQQVRLELTNEGMHPHSIEVHLDGKEAELASPVSVGNSGSLTFTTPSVPGKYVFYCPVGNHRAEGMEGTLVVQ